jgi:alkanesulfonate monooxygenase SsuD/methylene tetrahydromethanopterin reductase-like flavin-dependent oxidoreductase (luciferase family)
VQVTLKQVARYGDVCNVIGGPAALEHKSAVLKQHCETARRDYQSIHRTALTLCLIADTDEQRASCAKVTGILKPEGLARIE